MLGALPAAVLTRTVPVCRGPETAQLGAAAGFVTGRKCYEGFLGYWPSATGPWAEVLNPMPKYIASRSLSGDLDWLSLELLDVTAFESGVVLQRYRPQT